MKLKKTFIYISAVLALASAWSVASAATDCVYSADYTFYRGFEGWGVGDKPNVYWKAFGSESYAEIVDSKVCEGSRAMKFRSRLIFQTDTPTWKFAAGDVIEISGYVSSDSTATVELLNANKTDVPMSGKVTVGTGWRYISGRYTITAENEVFIPMVKAQCNSGEYAYVDNLTVRRVLQSAENPKIKKIDTHNGVYAAIDCDNNLWMWGESDSYILNESNTPQATPVKKMTNVSDVCIGENHVVVLRTDGAVWTWGENNYGQLGNGTTESRANPVKIASYCRSISAGNEFTVMITKTGAMLGCGRRDSGQWTSSDGILITEPTRVIIRNYWPVDRVVSTDSGTAVRLCNGDLYSIGYNGQGQLGLGDYLPRLTYTETVNKIFDVAVSDNYTLVSMRDGKVYGMGFGDYGQLGSTVVSAEPVLLSENGAEITAGKYSSYIIGTDGKTTVFGNASAGLANSADNPTPTELVQSPVAIAADTNVMYVTADGTLYVNDSPVTIVTDSEQTPEPEPEKPIEKQEFGLSFKADGKLLYNFDKSKYGKAALVVGGYKDGRLVDVETVEFDNSSYTSYTVPTIEGADTYKIMLWKDLDTIKPLEGVKLVELAEVRVTADELDGNHTLTVSGTASSIDGRYSDETAITIVASTTEVPTQESIYHMDEFYVNASGTFTKTIPIKTNPKDTYIYVRVSDEKIKNLIN